MNPIPHEQLVEQGNPFQDAIDGAKLLEKEVHEMVGKIKADMAALHSAMSGTSATTPEGQGQIKNLSGQIAQQSAQYNKLQSELKALTAQYNAMKSAAAQYGETSKRAAQGESTIVDRTTLAYKNSLMYKKLLHIETNALDGSVQKLKATYARLVFEMNNFSKVGSEGYKKLQAEAAQYNAQIKKSEQGHGVWARSVGNYATAIRTAWMGITVAMSGTFYAAKRWVMMNAELSDSMAAVRRTTGMTQQEVYGLNERLRTLNTRTAQTSLLDLAHVAGKLGIAKNEIFGFVKAADMIGVALGKDLGNNEEAINQLGRIAIIFKQADKFGMERALLKIGSALKDLGNASVAEETNIIDFTKRMGGLASVTGISIDKIMGLGATMDILGQTMEVSSTAVNQIWIGMAQKTEKFAKIAGMSVDDFRRLMVKDFNEAFIAVAEGLQKSKGGIFELAEYFNGLGLDGRRLIGVMAVLSGNIAQFRTQMDIAKKSLDKGTTAMDQYNIQNETLAATIDRATKALQNFVANSFVLSSLQWVIAGIANNFERIALMDQIAKRQGGAGPLDIPTSLSQTRFKQDMAVRTKDDGLKKKLEFEVYLGYKVLAIDKLRKENQEAINKLKQDQAMKDLAAGLLNPDGTKKTKAQIKADKLAAQEAAKLLKQQQKQEESYYQFLLSLDRVTLDDMLTHEREKLTEQGVWQKASAEEIEQYKAEVSRKYQEKAAAKTLSEFARVLNAIRNVSGSKDFSGGKFNIPSGPNGENAGLMQGYIPGALGTIQQQPNDISGQLAGGLDALYAYNADNVIETDSWNKKFKEIEQATQEFASAMSQLLGSISANYQVNMDNDLAAVEDRYTKEYEALDEAIRNKTMSERIAADKKIALEKKQKSEQLAIEKEYRKKQQDLAYIQAIINIAVGATQALAQGGVLGILMGLAVVAAGAIELDTISSQKFAKGGSGEVNNKGLVLSGKRHSYGGIPINGIGEAEDGEYFAIINRGATAKYRNELPELFSAINEGRVDQLFDRRGMPSVNVNVNDRYGREMLGEMRKPRTDTKITDTGTKIIYETGNYRLVTHKQ